MEKDRSIATRALVLIAFGLLAFAITTLAGGIWSALLVTNLQSTPALPWSAPAMALLLWLAWSYLGGGGWPRGTSETRRGNPRPQVRQPVTICIRRLLDRSLPTG